MHPEAGKIAFNHEKMRRERESKEQRCEGEGSARRGERREEKREEDLNPRICYAYLNVSVPPSVCVREREFV